jgi:hypothetical protein
MQTTWMLGGWTPTFLLVIAVWLGRNLIRERLTHGIKHEYDIKLANVQNELKQAERRIEAQLREKESEIRVLREGALSQLAQRHIVLDKRRIEAAERIWVAAMSFGAAKPTVVLVSMVKFAPSLAEAEKNPQFRRTFETCIDKDDFAQLGKGADNERPFLSDIAWALYQAYRAAIAYAVLKGEMLKKGLNFPHLIDSAPVIRAAKEALPHRAAYIEEHQESAVYNLLQELESSLLKELRTFVTDPDATGQHVHQANAILRATKEVVNEGSVKQLPPEFIAPPAPAI